MVGRGDRTVNAELCRSDWSAREYPVNGSTTLEQRMWGRCSSWCVGCRALKPGLGERVSGRTARDVKIEIPCDDKRGIGSKAAHIIQAFVQLDTAYRVVSAAFKMEVVVHQTSAA